MDLFGRAAWIQVFRGDLAARRIRILDLLGDTKRKLCVEAAGVMEL